MESWESAIALYVTDLLYCSICPGTNLPVTEVMSHMRSVLESKTLGAWFGNDYSQILLNYILSVPEYVIQLTAQHWDGEQCLCVRVQYF